MLSILLTAVSLLASAIFLQRWLSRPRVPPNLSLPPGPKGLPVLGNLLQIPHAHQWLTYSRWKKEYGEIIYAQVFNTSLIILGSAKATHELFERRSGNYADRPRMVNYNQRLTHGS